MISSKSHRNMPSSSFIPISASLKKSSKSFCRVLCYIVGTWDYFQPTADGRTQFTITEDIINEFRDMEAQMFESITD